MKCYGYLYNNRLYPANLNESLTRSIEENDVNARILLFLGIGNKIQSGVPACFKDVIQLTQENYLDFSEYLI